MPSALKFPKSRWVNGTSFAQLPTVNRLQQMIGVWPCTIHPGAADAQGQWCSECAQTTKGYICGSKTIHEGNHIHEDSLANIIQLQALNGRRWLQTGHWTSGWSAGNSRCFCRYTINVSISWWTISQNRSPNVRSCKSWILFNACLSDLWYWQCPKIYIVKTEDKYNWRMVGR